MLPSRHSLAYFSRLLVNIVGNALVVVVAHRGYFFAGATDFRNNWIIVIN
jgi:hypothetical protein